MMAAARSTGSAVEAANNAVQAVERALHITPVDGLVVVTGSVYLVGEVRPMLVAMKPALPEPLKV
jgi:dihydrofolate synthase / folylpolyglutamate synthase